VEETKIVREILTAEEIQRIDRLATEKFHIPSCILMENAGKGIADYIISRARMKFTSAAVICGTGRNAGDGFVVARYLFIKKKAVKVAKFKPDNEYAGDTAGNLKILRALNIPILDISQSTMEDVREIIHSSDVLVDAIFGIGINKSVDGIFKDVITEMNTSGKCIVSVDIPSGLNPDTGEPMGVAVSANYTLTIGFMKRGFLSAKAKKYTGKIHVIDIGYPPLHWS
jgi:NAD(P)H-hydrate epimerase